ncbi:MULTISPECIES: thiosulfate oxidation carrier protein SoxY [unclassified Hyphomicrobium]|uniref:thiosulfate oxidation carrier protein SoxY n=1 Tax=unclassified Hyphomicrobium TaxID=2619925 RepID=UPI000213ED51|nr:MULTISPECIES: thiosulfate oxidation carrier protein SoxY [unclassified Hyphomicrobium]CCB65422.1 Thiosulfate-binding protein SoxY [Hyphomicrobium sp. MC1]
MHDRIDIAVLSRRTFLIAGVAAAGLAPFIARANADASASDAFVPSQDFKDDFARIVGNAKPIDGKISVDLPETADNGNFVPITIVVDSPMTEADHVKAIHILSTANPHAHVATFRLSPVNAVALVQSRMRLAKTQEVIVLAELSSGDMLVSTTRVKVLIGGCGI